MTLRTKLMVVAVALSMLAVFARSAGTRTQAMPAAGVQVAVGVYDGGQFVKGLTQADFQVLENGEPCTIECLYEINKDAITRQEGNAPAAPVTARRFHLLFQMIDYDAKVAEALRYFITDALLPGDSLSVQTPVKTYVLTPEALAQKPRQILAKEMDQIVRTDIGKGNFVYKGLIRELRGIVAAYEHRNPLANGDEDIVDPTYSQVASLLESYRGPLNKFEALRAVDQDAVLGFAQGLKKQDGRKLVFLIYEQEFRPELSPQTISQLMQSGPPEVSDTVNQLFQMYSPEVNLDQKKIVQAYCDSSANFNLLFITKIPEKRSGITMHEMSQDIFKTYSQVATATGGIAETTANLTVAVQDALKASEAYYLLSYTPASASKDGEFRTISVKVKDKDYKVLSRRGYIKG